MVRNIDLIFFKQAQSKFPSYGTCKPPHRSIERNLASEVGVCRFQMRISVFHHFLVKFEVIYEPVPKLRIAAELWNLKYR